MIKKIKKWFKTQFMKYFDYEITESFYAPIGDGRYKTFHTRKYYLKCFKKFRKKRRNK